MTTDATPLQNLLDLFATSLADVRFADLDAQTLARLAADVDAAQAAVSSAEAALSNAREVLDERRDALLQQGQRALAYARVYAERDDTLMDRVNAITLPRVTRRVRGNGDALVLSPDPEPASRPRGRSRKATSTAAPSDTGTLPSAGE